MDRYKDLRIGLADASVVVLSHRHSAQRVHFNSGGFTSSNDAVRFNRGRFLSLNARFTLLWTLIAPERGFGSIDRGDRYSARAVLPLRPHSVPNPILMALCPSYAPMKIRGSGNVFRDLGFADEEAENLREGISSMGTSSSQCAA